MGSNLIERTKFYLEIASCSIDYCPPVQYFTEVLASIEDMQKQINDLRADSNRMRKELEKITK